MIHQNGGNNEFAKHVCSKPKWLQYNNKHWVYDDEDEYDDDDDDDDDDNEDDNDDDDDGDDDDDDGDENQ